MPPISTATLQQYPQAEVDQVAKSSAVCARNDRQAGSGTGGPDYEGLVKLLSVLRNFVDACGEVRINNEEAARISTLGFPAKAGRWRVPPVPPELVTDNHLLEHLALGWTHAQSVPQEPTGQTKTLDQSAGTARATPKSLSSPQLSAGDAVTLGREKAPESKDGKSHPEKAASRAVEHRGPTSWTKEELKILEIVRVSPGAGISKRRLQQRLWRIPARRLNRALRSLEARGILARQARWMRLSRATCLENENLGTFVTRNVTQAAEGAGLGQSEV